MRIPIPPIRAPVYATSASFDLTAIVRGQHVGPHQPGRAP
jgi:hypothetical protein